MKTLLCTQLLAQPKTVNPCCDPWYMTRAGTEFCHGALLIQGKDTTYAAIDHVGLDEEIGCVGWSDMLPGGTHDGKVEHKAAIVIFEWQYLGPSDPEHSDSNEYELAPVKWEPVSLAQALDHTLGDKLWREVKSDD